MSRNFDTWLKSLGPLTRGALGLSVLLTTISSVGVVPPEYLVLLPSSFPSFELWRPITAAFYFGNFSFSWLISIAMFTLYANYNESNDFKGKPGDMLWMVILIVLGLTAGAVFIGSYTTSFSLMMALCWVFCNRHPYQMMNLYGFDFDAKKFPWVLLVFHVILGNGIIEDLLGIVVGHLFFFFKDITPKTHRSDPLRTPAWFLRYVMPNAVGPGFGIVHPENHPYDQRFARRQQQQQQQQGPGTVGGGGGAHRWGAGRTLGEN